MWMRCIRGITVDSRYLYRITTGLTNVCEQ